MMAYVLAFHHGCSLWKFTTQNERRSTRVHICPRGTSQEGKSSEPGAISRRLVLQRTLLASTISLPAAAPASARELYFDKYDRYASTYERLDGTTFLTDILGFSALRAKLVGQAKGDVLEIGIGTGVNLPLYNYNQVSSVTGVDFSAEMLSYARKRIAETDHGNAIIRLLQARAEDVRLPNNSYDTVVDTFSLCVFPQPEKALMEMKRLLKETPKARVLLLEHSLSLNPLFAAYQNLTAEPIAAMSKGCYPNQDVFAMVRRIGFKVLKRESHLAGTILYLELGL